MKLLLLLTHVFPYDDGEEFLSNEIGFIKGFDRVVVCPCCLARQSVRTRSLPEGIGCFPVIRTEIAKSAYAGLFAYPPVLREIAGLIRTGRFSAGRVHELFYFMKNAFEIFEGLKKIPELPQAGEVLIYSYWFYDTAAAGALLADELKKRGVRVKQISRAHGFDIYENRRKYDYLPMRKYLFSKVGQVFPCSENGTAVLK